MRRGFVIALSLLAGCGGGGGSHEVPPQPATLSPAPAAQPTPNSSGNLSVTVRVPVRGVSSKSRKPKYVPSGAAVLDLQLSGAQNSPTYMFTLASQCATSTAGVYICSLSAPPDNYQIYGQIKDGSGATLATNANASPTNVAVRGGTNSATLTMQGVVSSVYIQMPILCIDPSSLASSPRPIRFLDADGEEIIGTFANPVSVTSSNPSVAYPATTSGTSITTTPVTSDPTVTSSTYPTTPGFEITGGGSEGTATIKAQVQSQYINVTYGTNFVEDAGSSFETIYVDHHLIVTANTGTPNLTIYGLSASNAVGQCDTITTPLNVATTVIADGTNDVVVTAGSDASSPTSAFDVYEYNLTPATYSVDLTGGAPLTSLNSSVKTISHPAGTLSLARSATTHSIYLGNSSGSNVYLIRDSTFPLQIGATYTTGSPSGMVVGAANSIAVANSTNNGDVVFVPDSVNGGNVGIITHADSPASAQGMNYNLHSVTPDGPEPLYGYSASSYSNGSTRQIAFTLNDNGAGYIHYFDANFLSAPSFSRTSIASPSSSPNTLTTGNNDYDYYYVQSGSAICYNAQDPPMFPYNCGTGSTANAIASAGDNTYLAAVYGTSLIVYVDAIFPAASFPSNSQTTTVAGAVPAFYTR